MIYEFKCANDGCEAFQKEVEFEAPITEGPPNNPICSSCGEKLGRIFSGTVKIPEWFKATSDMGGDNFNNIKSKMSRSRPSGKSKIFY